MTERRLFVGNLPKDVSDSKIEKLFSKYEASKIELKRKKVLDDESVFAFVNIPVRNVDKCLSELSDKKWKDYNLKVEIAKESFLDRLKKEHSEKNQKNNTKSAQIVKNSFQLRQNSNGTKNKKIKFDSDNEFEESESTVIDNSFDDVPRKRNLPMFRGTTSIVTTETQSSNLGSKQKKTQIKSSNSGTKQDSNKKVDMKSSANEANSAMKRFEDFSDVWKDEPVRSSQKYNNINFKGKSHRVEEKEEIVPPSWRIRSNDRVESEPKMNQVGRKLSSWKISRSNDHIEDGLKSNQFEEKEAMPPSWKIRSNNDYVEEPFKYTDGRQNKSLQWKSAKPDTEYQDEKSMTENEKKPVKWKTVVPDDDRFQLDEKFFDTDDFPAQNAKQKKKFSAQGSLDDKFQKNGVFEHRQLIRYDPTRPDHKIIEKNSLNSQPSIPSEKKKKTKKKLEKPKMEQKGTEKPEPIKPEVSKEKHYQVADTLVNTFKKTENQSEFRLSSLFDEKIKQENHNLPKRQTNIEVPLEKPTAENSPQRDSNSEGEDDMEEEPVEVIPPKASEKVLGKCGVWGETFFFKKDDSRLKEAMDFFKPDEKKKIIDFDKQRIKLRVIVRKKLQNSKKDNKLFKEKLGGKLNKSKFKKRLKNAGHC